MISTDSDLAGRPKATSRTSPLFGGVLALLLGHVRQREHVIGANIFFPTTMK